MTAPLVMHNKCRYAIRRQQLNIRNRRFKTWDVREITRERSVVWSCGPVIPLRKKTNKSQFKPGYPESRNHRLPALLSRLASAPPQQQDPNMCVKKTDRVTSAAQTIEIANDHTCGTVIWCISVIWYVCVLQIFCKVPLCLYTSVKHDFRVNTLIITVVSADN